MISTVDPDARRGRKSSAGKFDGYKGHVAIDPDSEIITDAAATPANTGDGQLTGRLTADLDRDTGEDHNDDDVDGPAVYGDAAYGSGEQLAELERRGLDARVETQPPAARDGKFSKDGFDIDLDQGTVSCPAGYTVAIVASSDGSGTARFASLCHDCPLRGRCTDAARGRNLTVHRHEKLLARQRARVVDSHRVADDRAMRPKVERKLAHLVRPTVLGVRYDAGTWATVPA